MKKQFLSLMTASLMLGNAPKLCAGPELFLGGLAAIAGAIHLRHAQNMQIKKIAQEKKSLNKMFNNHVLRQDIIFSECAANNSETNTPCIAIKTEKINDTWMWQAFYLPEGFAAFLFPTKNSATLILEEPVLTSPRAERYDDYLKKFEAARNDLIARAQALIKDLTSTEQFLEQ